MNHFFSGFRSLKRKALVSALLLVILIGGMILPYIGIDLIRESHAAVGPIASTCTGVTVNPGTDNLQAAIDANPGGTTFCLWPGIYRMTTYVIPKSNDQFIGQPGTILNGSKLLTSFTQWGSTWYVTGQTQQNAANPAGVCAMGTACQYADDVFRDNQLLTRVMSLAAVTPGTFFFDYSADRIYVGDNPTGHTIEAAVATRAFKSWGTAAYNVTVRGLVVEKFANEAQIGAINANDGWVVENCEVRLNHGAGVQGGVTVRNNYLHHNGQEGMATGVGLFEGNEVAFNNTLGFDSNWEAGGVKVAFTSNYTARNNYIHDNDGPGLWTDTDNIYTVYEGNRVENNTGPGIFHEVSYDAIIRNNIVRNNATGVSLGQSIWYSANIYIYDSSNVEVYGNTVEGDANGIGLRDDNRGSGAYGLYEVRNVHVHDNTIIMRAGQTGLVTSRSAASDPTNRFVQNTYHVTSLSSPFWHWNANKTWSQWQAIPQDATGSADTSFSTPTPTPSPSPSPSPIPTPSLSVSPSSVAPNGTVMVTLTNGTGYTTDQVQLAAVGAPAYSYVDWWFLNGTKTQPTTGLTSATLSITMPTTPGQYEFRFYDTPSYTWLATSNTVTVTASPTPTPTPGPTACSQYTPSTSIPTGFGSPYDVVSSPSTNLMNVTCLNLTDARLDLGKGDPLQYIYNTGYLFKTGQTAWTPISYTSSESLIANAWYPKTATTNITMTSAELGQPSYNLAYICSWTGSAWKCGCRDQACTQSYWMIQSFKR